MSDSYYRKMSFIFDDESMRPRGHIKAFVG